MDPRYPIGKVIYQPFDAALLKEYLLDIKYLPQLLENAVLNLSESQLQTPYREGGWSLYQVVHHVADSHLNAYTRFKLACSEAVVPTVTPYSEQVWAEMSDVHQLPANISLTLLHALHARWHNFMESLQESDWTTKAYYHPEHQRNLTLWDIITLYAWHGKHHAAQITTFREKMNW